MPDTGSKSTTKSNGINMTGYAFAVARETECPYLALFPYGSTITEGPDSPFAGNSSPFLQTTTEYG